jgi:toxin HigB-1
MEITFSDKKLEKLANDDRKCLKEMGNRKGQWACDLDQPYRLVFEPHESLIPTDEHGVYIWFEIKGIEVIEIINYHKEK